MGKPRKCIYHKGRTITNTSQSTTSQTDNVNKILTITHDTTAVKKTAVEARG